MKQKQHLLTASK